MHLQGAKYDLESKTLDDSKSREDYFTLPVINCAVREYDPNSNKEDKNLYKCPVYKTTQRDISFVFEAQFRTKNNAPPSKWIIAGVACILDCEKTDYITKYPK